MGIFNKLKAFLNLDKSPSSYENTIEFDSTVLHKNGWLQGSICNINSPEYGCPVGDYIVVTQSCDLLYRHLEVEPFVELLKVEAVSEKNSGAMFGKSTRELVFDCGDTYWKAGSIVNRVLLPREHLLKLHPIAKVNDERNFSSWLGRRYDRVAFPDNFNNLFPNASKCDAAKAYTKLVSFARKYDSSICEIWVKLNSWTELLSTETYKFSIAFLCHDLDKKSLIQEELEELIEGVRHPKKNCGIVAEKGIRGCLVGIEIDEYLVLELHEFSRADMDSYSLFNLDYISHSSGENLSLHR